MNPRNLRPGKLFPLLVLGCLGSLPLLAEGRETIEPPTGQHAQSARPFRFAAVPSILDNPRSDAQLVLAYLGPRQDAPKDGAIKADRTSSGTKVASMELQEEGYGMREAASGPPEGCGPENRPDSGYGVDELCAKPKAKATEAR